MKKELRNFIGFMLVSVTVFLSTGCMEHNYYHQHHYHTRGWYDRHHSPPPPGVNFDIHN